MNIDKVVSLYLTQPTEIKIIWALGLLFLALWAGYTLLLFLLKAIRKNKKQRDKKISTQQKEITDDLLFSNLSMKDIPKNLHNKHYKRELYLRLLMQYQRTFKGNEARKIASIYKALNLTKHSLRKLRSRKYHLVIQGIQELARMQHTGLTNLCMPFIHAKEPLLASEAQIQIIQQYGFTALGIFENYTNTISRWQQVRILNTLKNFQNYDEIQLSPLLHSSNRDVVMLTLKVIGENGLFSAADEVFALRKSAVPRVREQVYLCMEKLSQSQRAGEIHAALKNEKHPEVKAAILKCLGSFADSASFASFKREIEHPQFEVAYQAAKGLLQIGATSDTQINHLSKRARAIVERVEEEAAQ
jgi:hypothetical protein